LLLGTLVFGGSLAMLAMPGCDPGGGNNDGGQDGGADGGHDAGMDGGADSGSSSDGGSSDGGQDGGVPSCQGFTAPTVPLQVSSSCPTFTACGGNPAGRWAYDGGCAENPFTSVPGCAGASISPPAATINGCVSFSGALSGTVARKVDWVATTTIHFPSSCVPTNCSDLQTVVRTYYPNATCSAATGGCDCAVSRDGGVNDTTSYVVNGTDIIAGGITYPFCIPTTNIMQYQEASSTPQLPQGHLGRR
jgi:hypothetical protein